MKTIGRYIIRSLLGRGGMGRIYKVELPVIGKIAALKLLAPDPLLEKLMGREKLQRLFEHEAAAMAALVHPNIVTVHDFDQHQGRPFYVMDFFANNLGALIGETYRVDQPSRPLPVARAIDYSRQTLHGLAGLHAAGMVHRDIKPFNLLITAWDTIKICDFGLSKLRGEAFAGPRNLNVGSPFYAAPEQEDQPDTADARADLYAVGVMLYRMLSGRLPRLAPAAPVAAVSRFNPALDDAWEPFLAQALAVDPRRRFTSATHMAAALEELAEHWRAQKEKVCGWTDTPAAVAEQPAPATDLRSTPIKTGPDRARDLFDLDELWRPRRYITNRFDHDSHIVIDHTTGLVWQRSGRAAAGSWSEAHAYIDALNSDRHTGRTGWHLPTIAQLCSLMRPPDDIGTLCIAPLFDQQLHRLWSGDRRSFTAAYYADLDLGFIGWQDTSAALHVRAVTSI